MCPRRRGPSDISLFSHGTTVATNAVITRTGALDCAGDHRGLPRHARFRRTDRAEHFDLWWQPAGDADQPPRRARGARARRRQRQRHDRARRGCGAGIAARLAGLGIEAVAISSCTRSSTRSTSCAWPSRARGLPDAYVCASHAILPEILEYERTTTTMLNAYVGPVMRDYFGRLDADLREDGFAGDILISSSAGGVHDAGDGLHGPGQDDTSGPAAGVIAAAAVAARAGYAQRRRLRHGRHERRHRRRARRRVRRTQRRATSSGARRSASRRSTSSRSAPAAAASRGSTAAGCCAAARRAPAPTPGPPVTAGAAASRPTPTPSSCSGAVSNDRFLGGEMESTPRLGRRGCAADRRAARARQRRAGRRG